MTVFDQTIHEILERTKPIGTTWVVLVIELDATSPNLKATYGPFDKYEEAQTWLHQQLAPDNTSTTFEVLPLYARSANGTHPAY
jgi:hypothetical protein